MKPTLKRPGVLLAEEDNPAIASDAKSPILQGVDSIRGELERLEERLSSLEKKLSPVLTPKDQGDEGAEKKRECVSPLAELLLDFSSRIEGYVERIGELHNRAEL